MRGFDRHALNDGVRGREVFGWAAYDFANSGYTTVVLTAVFNAYFVGVVAGNASWATLAWTAALSLSNLLVMLTMPAIGAYADAHRRKRRLLAWSTVGCVLGTAALALTGPGTLLVAVLAVVASNYCYAMGETLIAAFLPELARPRAIGRVSGWGWAFGYFGGMLTLGLCLAYVLSAQAAGRPATTFVPMAMLITAAVFALASVPTFALLRERGVAGGAEAAAAAAGSPTREPVRFGARLSRSFRESRGFVDFRRLLVCGVCYQAGISVVIALAAVYAEQVMHFTSVQTMALIFTVNIAAAVGAFGFGYVEDRIGHRRALQWTLLAWIGMVLIAGLGRSAAAFWIAATIAGLCMGSSQSCGRAIVGVLAPPSRIAEFYGLWALAVRLASIVGPLTYGAVTWATGGDHRTAILSTGSFFVLGLIALARIDLVRGEQAARA
ncbi:MAG: MFS transporter [Burkholderiaceae bacterium]